MIDADDGRVDEIRRLAWWPGDVSVNHAPLNSTGPGRAWMKVQLQVRNVTGAGDLRPSGYEPTPEDFTKPHEINHITRNHLKSRKFNSGLDRHSSHFDCTIRAKPTQFG